MSAVVAAADNNLPNVWDHPQADVVIYDGQCKFCIAGVTQLKRFDRGGRLAFISLHDPEVARRWPDLTHQMLMDQMYVVDQRGRRHGGARAIRYLTRRLPLLWVFAPFAHVPFTLPILDWAYHKVAERRYRLMGKTGPNDDCASGACAVHLRKH